MKPLIRSLLVLVFLLIAVLLPQNTMAQSGDEELTNIYESDDGAFSFRYPDTWELSDEANFIFEGVRFSVDMPATSVTDDGFSIELEALGIVVNIGAVDDGEATPESLVTQSADTWTAGDGSAVFTVGELSRYTLNGQAMAAIEVSSMLSTFRFVALDLGDGQFAQVTLTGVPEQFFMANPTVYAVLHSIGVDGAPIFAEVLDVAPLIELSETYTLSDNTLTFNYPDGWAVNETESYALVDALDGYSLGISTDEFLPDEDPTEAVGEFAAYARDSYLEEYDLTVHREVSRGFINGRPLAYFVMYEEPTDTLFMMVVYGVTDERMVRITVLGSPRLVAAGNDNLHAIMRSMEAVE